MCQWLRERAPGLELEALFRSAVVLVLDDFFPARVHLAAHAMREICNRLHDALIGDDITSHVDYRRLTAALLDAWRSAGFPPDGSRPAGFPTNPPLKGAQAFEVPHDLVSSVSDLLVDHIGVATSQRRRTEEFLERAAGAPVPRYAMGPWKESTEWARKYAHARHQPLPAGAPDELREAFSKFETALQALIRPSFENLDDIDEILARANS